jgi:DNA-binding GntR family transcriptional regulator
MAIRADYPDPLWIQAVNLVNAEIATGDLKPGSRLPPERELCQQLQISRVTLRKALNRLVEDGVLQPSHGRGWYVATPTPAREWPNSLESFSETANRMGLTASSTVLRAATTPATLDEAELLGVAPGTPLFHLDRVRRLDGVPIALDHTCIPIALAPELASADFTTVSLYDALAAAGVEPVRADATVEAREAGDDVAGHLGLDRDKPVLAMHQVAMDADDRPLFASTIQYSGERYRLRTVFSRASRATSRPRGKRVAGA